MLVPHYAIRLSAAEQQALETLQRAGKTSQQPVRRVNILLLAQAGLSNQAIADQVGTSRNLVQKWRKRFALYEPPPLLAEEEGDPVARLAASQDLPRSGRPRIFPPLARHTVVAVACQGTEGGEFGGFSHYSVRDLGSAGRRAWGNSHHESRHRAADFGGVGAQAPSAALLLDPDGPGV